MTPEQLQQIVAELDGISTSISWLGLVIALVGFSLVTSLFALSSSLNNRN